MPPGRRFGRYQLHEKLAVGGMGELYLATIAGSPTGTPSSVLKILLPEFCADRDFVSMFHDEARIGMQLAHPNIVAVTDLGRVGDTPFIVLEFVHGENVKNMLRRCQELGEKFPAELAVRVTIEALHGLDHAHNAKDARGKPINLVHRDLSPDNLMVSFDGDVKVLDFGIAKAEGRATQTQFGILKGKAQYMSPEQAVGAEVDARTDLYAIGLVLLEVVTGVRRFSNDTDPVQQIRDARVWKAVPPSERDATLPVELDAILLKALQPDRERRWQSAEEFAIALTRLLRDGKLPRTSENLPRFMRRLFPGRAEPYLSEDPTKGATDHVLAHTDGAMTNPDAASPAAVKPAKARPSAAAPEAGNGMAETVIGMRPVSREPTVERLNSEETTENARPTVDREGRTLIQPGRRPASEEPTDEHRAASLGRGKPAAPSSPSPPRRAPVVDAQEETTSEFDRLGDRTRTGSNGASTRIADLSELDPDARTNRPTDDERTHGGGPPPMSSRSRNAIPVGRRDPSADERRAPRGRAGAAPAEPDGGPSYMLLFVLFVTLVLVASAAGALVFSDELPPWLRDRVIDVTENRDHPRTKGAATPVRTAVVANPGAATPTPTTARAVATAAAAAATPSAAASPAGTALATATARPASTPTVALASPSPSPAASPRRHGPQRAAGGGVFPEEAPSPTPAAVSSAPAPVTPVPVETTEPLTLDTPTPKPVLTPITRGTPAPSKSLPARTPSP